jgi:hypothetical protein
MDSRAKPIEINVHDIAGLNIREFVKTKAREGPGRPVVEQQSGDQLQCRTNRWVKLTRLIDRKGDRYFEQVLDPASGEVIHFCMSH